jgi:predicted acetyltransferase
MSVEVRACEPHEVLQAMAPIWHYFGKEPTEDSALRVTRFLEPRRAHAAWADGAVVGGAGCYTFRLTVPGGRLPTAGVAVVGVLPTHRRRGVLRALMRAQLEDVRERGEPLAALWSADERIYGRFGYGMASLCGEIELSRDHAALHETLGPVENGRLVSPEEGLDLLPTIYEQVAAVTPGMLERSREWWEVRILADPPERRFGGGEMARVVVVVDGEPAGYALYRLNTSFEAGVSTGSLRVIEAMGTTPEATRDVWRTLLELDWIDRIKASLLPVDHPLLFLLAEPRRMRFRVGDALWVRLVDVGAALSGRSYAVDGAVVFEVADHFCPWNEGRWKLEAGQAARTDQRADLRCEVSALGSVYLGGFTFAQLARAGRVEELRPGGLERADALFRTDRAPWCPEIF